MTFTPIPKGTTSWDVPLNAALADQDARITVNESDISDIENAEGFRPNELGFITWNYDPANVSGQSAFTPGTVHMFRMEIKRASMISNIIIGIQTAGNVLTAGQNFAGIYDSSGNQLRITADQSVPWITAQLAVMPLTSPLNVTPGSYYIAVVANGTTAPSVSRSFGAAAVGPIGNAGTTVTNARWANGPTGQTSLPASINMSTRTYGPTGWWAALS